MITKIKKSIALIAICLFSITGCSNDRESEIIESNKSKDVYVKIEKLEMLETRAESTEVQDEKQVEFNGGDIYFTSNIGLIERHVKIVKTGESNDSEVTIDDLGKGHIFKNLPSLTASVLVVGNTELNINSGRISSVKNQRLSVDTQKEFDNVNLFGVSGLQKKSEGKDNEFEAEVVLTPTVSRLEIGNIKSKGNVIKGYNVEGIFIDGYVVESDVEGKLDDSNVLSGKDVVTEFQQGSNTFPVEYKGIVYDWYPEPLASISDGNYQTVKPSGNNSIWAYNVFSEKKSKIAPRIIIRLTNIKYENNKVLETPMFLTAKLKLGDAYLEELEPSKIYTIGANGIIFDETNLTPEPNQEPLDIEVTVTLATWEKIDLDLEL